MAELERPSTRTQQSLTDDERRSLGELYQSNFAAVARLCQRMLGNREDAVDAAHEVFLRAMNKLDGQANRPGRPWLFTVARNHCVDILRRRKRMNEEALPLECAPETGADPESTAVARHTVAAVLRQLRLRERQVLWQSVVEGLPLDGIARNLGLSYMAAAQVLHRARSRASLAAAKVAAILGLVHAQPWKRARALSSLAIAPVLVAALQVSSSRVPPPPSSIPAAPRSLAAAAPSTALGTMASVHAIVARELTGERGALHQPDGGDPLRIPVVDTGRLLPTATRMVDSELATVRRQLQSVTGVPPAVPAVPTPR